MSAVLKIYISVLIRKVNPFLLKKETSFCVIKKRNTEYSQLVIASPAAVQM